MTDTYSLVDSGNGKKLERYGSVLISRPAPQALWEPQLPQEEWRQADAVFTREGAMRWEKKAPDTWVVEIGGILFRLSGTDFGHLGVFPEQKTLWEWIASTLQGGSAGAKVLNLFAYSGGATLASAKAGAEVCHLDASKGMVAWARDNAQLNELGKKPIRWIVDDVKKFLMREIRRGVKYDAIILDPPTYGRGSQGQVFKLEEDLRILLKQCVQILSDRPRFLLLSSHTPTITPIVLENLLKQHMGPFGGCVAGGEMLLTGSPESFALPNGAFARWTRG